MSSSQHSFPVNVALNLTVFSILTDAEKNYELASQQNSEICEAKQKRNALLNQLIALEQLFEPLINKPTDRHSNSNDKLKESINQQKTFLTNQFNEADNKLMDLTLNFFQQTSNNVSSPESKFEVDKQFKK